MENDESSAKKKEDTTTFVEHQAILEGRYEINFDAFLRILVLLNQYNLNEYYLVFDP